MIICCQRLPPSKLTALPMLLNSPPIHATNMFFGFVGLTPTEDSFSAPLEPQAAKISGSERPMSGPSRKSLARAGQTNGAATRRQKIAEVSKAAVGFFTRRRIGFWIVFFIG